MDQQSLIKIGISACLMGQQVRYDGGHRHNRFLTDTLGKYVTYVPVCPEVECGMSIPREPMRLVGDPQNPRLMTISTKKDYTRQMTDWAGKRAMELEHEDLCGFIFKSKSPSSGMLRVKVYNEETGIPSHTGTGMFAGAVMKHFPLLPTEEDGRLNDPVLRENFIERIFAFSRWREMLTEKCSVGRLVDFHTSHKLLLMAHSRKHYREMGSLVAQAKKMGIREAYTRYQELLMEALTLKTTPKKHADVLQHIMGYFKKELTADEKQELLETIDLYRKELVPLIVPITLVNHYVRKYNEPYLSRQYYLNPHPVELKLRNHV